MSPRRAVSHTTRDKLRARAFERRVAAGGPPSGDCFRWAYDAVFDERFAGGVLVHAQVRSGGGHGWVETPTHCYDWQTMVGGHVEAAPNVYRSRVETGWTVSDFYDHHKPTLIYRHGGDLEQLLRLNLQHGHYGPWPDAPP